MFSTDQLQNLADWLGVAPGYGLDSDQELSVAVVEPLCERLHHSGYRTAIAGDPGMSTHWCIWIEAEAAPSAQTGDDHIQVEGLHLLLCALGPYAALGRARRSYFKGGFGESGPELGDLLTPDASPASMANTVIEEVAQTPYRILTPEELRQPLPPHVKPQEYCLVRKPWDRVFHVLFAATD